MIYKVYVVTASAPNPHATGSRDTMVYGTCTLPDFVYNNYDALAIDALLRLEFQVMQETLVDDYWVDVRTIQWTAQLSVPYDTEEDYS